MTSGAIDEDAQRFGPYVLLHVAGAGGMGRVQLALSGRAGLAKLCVLKRIHSDVGNPEQEARFRREATLALRLSHGAIAQTFSVDEIEGELCIAQEFVEGVSLGRLLSSCRSVGEPVPFPVAVYVVRELGRALAYAHGLDGGGVIHRDVVPDNVMLSYSGEVKLIDFGIAKVVGDASLTQTGMIVGRISHTAPEVLEGNPADARADLYSLGVVMWELLSGVALEEVRARGGDSGSSLPAPSAHVAGIPPTVDAIVARLLADDPDARFQRAEELQQALGEGLAPGFVGNRALAELLERHFEIDRERDVLAIEVARAERGLGEHGVEAAVAPVAAAPEPLAVVPETAPIRTQGNAGKVAMVAAAAATVIVGAFWLRGGGERPPIGTVASAAMPALRRPVEPSVPAPPAPVEPPPPPPTRVAPPPAAPPAPPTLAPPPAEVPAALPRLAPTEPALPAPVEPPTAKALTLIARAEESFERGELPQALAFARSAARAGGGYRARLIAGKVLLADGRMAEAEAELVRAVALAPSGNSDAIMLLDRVRARRVRMGQ